MKKALILCPDTKPADSLSFMLEKIGVKSFVPSKKLWLQLHNSLGVNLVISNEALVSAWGYPPSLLQELDGKPDYIFDIKGHQNIDKLRVRFPDAKVIWYRINGGEPEVTSQGDEIDCNLPIVTPNQWYAEEKYAREDRYVFWPKLVKVPSMLDDIKRSKLYTPPIALIHNFGGWGYGKLADGLNKLSVQIYGKGSPQGLLTEKSKNALLKTTKALVHPKSTDAPGYAILEALDAACPVVISKRLLWRSSYNLLLPGYDCLAFDRETHDALGKEDVETILGEIEQHLKSLSDPYFNEIVGKRGRDSLRSREWGSEEDIDQFSKFMETI